MDLSKYGVNLDSVSTVPETQDDQIDDFLEDIPSG